MPIVDLVMPKMGESIMEATILRWNKKPGEAVKQDETVLEIATDKVDSEVPSTAEGILEEILFQENEVVPVGTVIARIHTQVESSGNEAGPGAPETPTQEPTLAPSLPAAAHDAQSTFIAHSDTPSSDTHSGPIREQISEEEAEALMAAVPYQPRPVNLNGSAQAGIRFYSPLVLNIATIEGVGLAELESISGTGNEGRVTKKDILQYIDNKRHGKVVPAAPAFGTAIPAANAQTTTPAQGISARADAAGTAAAGTAASAGQGALVNPALASYGGQNVEIIEMDRMRKMISKHMVDSKNISAHVTSFAEADVTNMVLWRDRIKKSFEHREGEKITFTPLFIDAVVKCLKRYPWLNSSVEGDKIILKKDIHIGMATALPSGNLIVPVIHNADQLNLVGLTKQVNGLAAAARNNKLRPEDTQGGTFTLTNVGSFGSIMGTPIINQPQVAILAVGVIKKRPVVVETKQGDSIAIRHIMYLSLSYDHRVIDGSLGSTFLSAVAKELEGFDPNLSI